MYKAIKSILALQQASGLRRKQEIIAANKHDDAFLRLLCDSLNPRVTFGVSERMLRRDLENPSVPYTFEDFQAVCADLKVKKALNAETISQVCSFLKDIRDEDEREVYIKVLAKTLRLGVTAKSVNKVIPGLLPEWEVQQAFPIEYYPLKNGEWFSVTQKLNGVRATFYDGRLYARSGVPYDGLDHITSLLSNEALDGLVFDGELTLLDKDGISDNEAFRITTGIVNSENVDKTRVCYTIFDMLPTREFDAGKSSARYAVRRVALDEVAQRFLPKDPHVCVLPILYAGTDQRKIPELLDKMVSEDKEGLMVNLNVPYQCKRHSGILKVKRFYTMDLPILRCESGEGRCADMLGSLVVDFNGVEVGVGSGFTDDQRKVFWEYREDLTGVLAEIKYKEISQNKKTGERSLQFPVFVALRTDKSDISFG